MYGPSPQGQQIVDASGHYSLVIIRSDLPKFASSNREAGTPEENKAVVQGSIAFFGTYTVDEAAKTLTQHVDSCTFPNWNGTDRKLSFTLSGDELHVTAVSKASTGTGTADFRRLSLEASQISSRGVGVQTSHPHSHSVGVCLSCKRQAPPRRDAFGSLWVP
jgi:hypothetical protein